MQLSLCYCCETSHEVSEAENETTIRPRRQCTDTLWLLVFATVLSGLVFVAFFALRVGDIQRTQSRRDSFGNVCGSSDEKVWTAAAISNDSASSVRLLPAPLTREERESRKYLMPLNVHNAENTVWICVAHCPRQLLKNELRMAASSDLSRLCSYGYHATNAYRSEHSSNIGPCPAPPVYPSTERNGLCVPSDYRDLHAEHLRNLIAYVEDEDFQRQLLSDLVNSLWTIAGACISSIVFGLVAVLFAAAKPQMFVYLTVVLSNISGIVFSATLWIAAVLKVSSLPYMEFALFGQPISWEHEWFISGARADHQFLFVLAVAVSLFTLLWLMFTWSLLFPKDEILAELFQQTARMLKELQSLFVYSLLCCVVSLGFCALAVYVWLSLTTIMEATNVQLKATDVDENRTHTVSTYKFHMGFWPKTFSGYVLAALLWLLAFIRTTQRTVVAGAVAAVYFSKRQDVDDEEVENPLLRSFYYVCRYHLGTIALGSLIITVLKIPRHVYSFIYDKLMGSPAFETSKPDSTCAHCMACTERLLRYINNNAYVVVIAIGEDFRSASTTAMNAVLDSKWCSFSLNIVAKYVFFMCKCFAAITCGFATGCILRANPKIEYWWMFAVGNIALAYFIVNFFTSIYETAIDTIFLCYVAEDNANQIATNVSDSTVAQVSHADPSFDHFMRVTVKEDEMADRLKSMRALRTPVNGRQRARGLHALRHNHDPSIVEIAAYRTERRARLVARVSNSQLSSPSYIAAPAVDQTML